MFFYSTILLTYFRIMHYDVENLEKTPKIKSILVFLTYFLYISEGF